MNFINQIIGYPLGWIMWLIYEVIPNYGVAIIIFTIIIKLLLFPISVKQQKSMARMNAFQPKVKALEKKFANNKEKLQEEQMKLYAEEGVNPAGSCLPLLLTFVVLFGIIDVVYKPMTHLLRMSGETITAATEVAQKLLTDTGMNMSYFTGRPQLYILQAFEMNPQAFSAISPDFVNQLTELSNNMNFIGFNLGMNPDKTWPTILIPILAGLSQLGVTIYTQWHQKKTNPTMPSMGAMNIMMYSMPIVSIFMAFNFPMGVGVYWIIQSVISFVQQIILNNVYTPERVAAMVEKDGSKKKKKGPNFMQRALEQQQAYKNDQAGTTASVKTETKQISTDEKLSKSAQKEAARKILADARKRMAEKYGEEYDDSDE